MCAVQGENTGVLVLSVLHSQGEQNSSPSIHAYSGIHHKDTFEMRTRYPWNKDTSEMSVS